MRMFAPSVFLLSLAEVEITPQVAQEGCAVTQHFQKAVRPPDQGPIYTSNTYNTTSRTWFSDRVRLMVDSMILSVSSNQNYSTILSGTNMTQVASAEHQPPPHLSESCGYPIPAGAALLSMESCSLWSKVPVAPCATGMARGKRTSSAW